MDEIGFWLGVGLVSIIAIALFKLIAVKLGASFPAMADLAAFI